MNALFANRVFQIFLLLALLCVAVVFSFSDMRWREQIRNFTFDNYNSIAAQAKTCHLANSHSLDFTAG